VNTRNIINIKNLNYFKLFNSILNQNDTEFTFILPHVPNPYSFFHGIQKEDVLGSPLHTITIHEDKKKTQKHHNSITNDHVHYILSLLNPNDSFVWGNFVGIYFHGAFASSLKHESLFQHNLIL